MTQFDQLFLQINFDFRLSHFFEWKIFKPVPEDPSHLLFTQWPAAFFMKIVRMQTSRNWKRLLYRLLKSLFEIILLKYLSIELNVTLKTTRSKILWWIHGWVDWSLLPFNYNQILGVIIPSRKNWWNENDKNFIEIVLTNFRNDD